MVPPSSRPRLIPGLKRREGELYDRAMCRRIRINDTAEFIVERMDGATSLSRIADEVCATFGVAEWVALADATSFVETLREYDVADIAYPPGHYLRTLFFTVMAPGRPSLEAWKGVFLARTRVDVRGGSFVGILARVTLQILFRHLLFAVLLTLVTAALIFVLIGKSLLHAVLIPAAVYGVLLLGLGLHETAHLYALRRRTTNPHLGYLRLGPLEMGISHPYVGPSVNFSVAMAGPLCPAACGVALYAINVFFTSPLLAVCALLLVSHVLSLLPFFRSDGRNLLYCAGDTQSEDTHLPANEGGS